MAQKRSAVRRTQTRRFSPGIILLVLIGVGFLGVLGYAIWAAFRPVPILGEAVPIVGADHIPVGQKATDHNTDPPTSGQHYDEPTQAGFYENAPADENLVHSLEHGYVIVYYNCDELTENACASLVDDIRTAMPLAGVARNTGTPKLIAAPRPGMENLITYTSWGRIYRADGFDRADFLLFVEQNRNRAPEPQAP